MGKKQDYFNPENLTIVGVFLNMLKLFRTDLNKSCLKAISKSSSPLTRTFFNRSVLLSGEDGQKDVAHFIKVLNQYKEIDTSEDAFEDSATKESSPSFSSSQDVVLKKNNGKKGNSTTSSLLQLKELLKDLQKKSRIIDASVPAQEVDYNELFKYNRLDGIKALPEYLQFEKTQVEQISPIITSLSKTMTNDKEFFECSIEYLRLLAKTDVLSVEVGAEKVQDPINKALLIEQPILEKVKLIIWTMFTEESISGFIPSFRKLQYLESLKEEAKRGENVLTRDVDFFNLELLLNWKVFKDVGKISGIISNYLEKVIFDYNTLIIVSMIQNSYTANDNRGFEEDKYITDLRKLNSFNSIGLAPYLNDLPEESLFTKWYISQLNEYQKDFNFKNNLLSYKRKNEIQAAHHSHLHPHSKLSRDLNHLKNFIYKMKNNEIDLE